jgi:hypothetical protein
MRRSANEAVPKRDVLDEYTCKHVCILSYKFLNIFTKAELALRPGVLNLKTEDTFRTLATRDSFGPTGARLMSTHPLAG